MCVIRTTKKFKLTDNGHTGRLATRPPSSTSNGRKSPPWWRVEVHAVEQCHNDTSSYQNKQNKNQSLSPITHRVRLSLNFTRTKAAEYRSMGFLTALETKTGQAVDESTLQGKLVVLYFSSSWCKSFLYVRQTTM
jgi:hypothetical protein